jgi:hypothetical protein
MKTLFFTILVIIFTSCATFEFAEYEYDDVYSWTNQDSVIAVDRMRDYIHEDVWYPDFYVKYDPWYWDYYWYRPSLFSLNWWYYPYYWGYPYYWNYYYDSWTFGYNPYFYHLNDWNHSGNYYGHRLNRSGASNNEIKKPKQEQIKKIYNKPKTERSYYNSTLDRETKYVQPFRKSDYFYIAPQRKSTNINTQPQRQSQQRTISQPQRQSQQKTIQPSRPSVIQTPTRSSNNSSPNRGIKK